MSQHGIILILVSLLYQCQGLPVKENITQTQISSSVDNITNDLLNLANSCGNLFLADMIKSKIEYCKMIEKKPTKKDYECKMFYDINNQLCSSFERTEVDLKGNYDSKMSITQNIETICNDAKTWKSVTNYQPELNNLFNKIVLCLQVCNVDGMVSEDSNFFCKYYKWGSEMLSSVSSVITQSSSIIAPTNSEIKPEVKADDSITTNNAVSSQNSNVEPNSKEKNIPEQTTKSAIVLKQVVANNEDLKQVSKDASALQKPELKENDENAVPISLTSKSDLQKPIEEPLLKSDLGKENIQKPVIENPKPNVNHDLVDETDNDLENDFGPGDEPFSEQDNMDEDMNSDPKMDTEKSKENANINKLPLTSFNVDVGQREMVFPNTIQDTFVEEDDHFFPFFLTTIVLVGLLYVLYHNKSKVTKVILGLIVEGRQSNRRRNSRGHAYKRLDTLEQAMSASSTAPPSKIIY